MTDAERELQNAITREQIRLLTVGWPALEPETPKAPGYHVVYKAGSSLPWEVRDERGRYVEAAFTQWGARYLLRKFYKQHAKADEINRRLGRGLADAAEGKVRPLPWVTAKETENR